MTGLPLGGGRLEGAAESVHLAPLVGLLEGLAVAAVLYAAGEAAGGLAAAALALVAHLAVTGGLHLDGFSDYSEAVLSRARGGEAERILSDPRRGSFAVAATSTLLAARLGLLAEALSAPLAVATAYTASAYAMVLYLALSPPGGSGLGPLFKSRLTPWRLASSTMLAAAAASALAALDSLALTGSPAAHAAAALAAAGVAPLVALDSARRLGRASGDAAGFTFESALTASLAAAALAGG
jgi:adenosylcobinamide-GDP ribazoletransferase